MWDFNKESKGLNKAKNKEWQSTVGLKIYMARRLNQFKTNHLQIKYLYDSFVT